MNSIQWEHMLAGATRGPAGAVLRMALAALSLPYRTAVATRNLWYDGVPGTRKRVAAPVISIGNITTGGTGKTPMAARTAGLLGELGRRAAILTRGYKGRTVAAAHDDPQEAHYGSRIESDEAAVLRRVCPAARVVIDANRVRGAASALANGCNALVLDDGFQYRRLRRDLDVVLIDATRPFGYGRLLPRGLLREPPTSLRRANVIVVTHSDEIEPAPHETLLQTLGRLAPTAQLLTAHHRIVGWFDIDGRIADPPEPSALQVVLFAGIANFESFRRSVERLGVRVVSARQFPDHHNYTAPDVAELLHAAGRHEADTLLTTEKDAVKLTERWPADAVPLLSPRIEIAFDGDGERVFRECLSRVLNDESRYLS
ncbi:MAG: tetraacyldisaccharide 4'-kinase [Phycisphaerae bacterium]